MEEHPLLTKEKLMKILRQAENEEEIEILEYSVKPGTEAGDNYASEIAKCDITAKVGGRKKDFHWMVKMESTLSDFTKGLHLDEKEIIYYKEMVPKWNKLAEDRGASFRINNYGTPYAEYNGGKTRSILVMDNLKYHGYDEPPNKKKGLTLAHAKLALEELARFHALGYVYLKSYPNGLEEGIAANQAFLKDHIRDDPPPPALHMFRSFSSEIAHRTSIIQEPGQDFVSIFERFQAKNDAFDYLQQVIAPKPGAFNVICHSDMWFNNMLFK